jgi:hypothetical protein
MNHYQSSCARKVNGHVCVRGIWITTSRPVPGKWTVMYVLGVYESLPVVLCQWAVMYVLGVYESLPVVLCQWAVMFVLGYMNHYQSSCASERSCMCVRGIWITISHPVPVSGHVCVRGIWITTSRPVPVTGHVCVLGVYESLPVVLCQWAVMYVC